MSTKVKMHYTNTGRKGGWMDTEGGIVIVSYDTLVASVARGADGTYVLVRHWDGWSATTQRHINDSLRAAGLGRLAVNKAAWLDMPVVAPHVTVAIREEALVW